MTPPTPPQPTNATATNTTGGSSDPVEATDDKDSSAFMNILLEDNALNTLMGGEGNDDPDAAAAVDDDDDDDGPASLITITKTSEIRMAPERGAGTTGNGGGGMRNMNATTNSSKNPQWKSHDEDNAAVATTNAERDAGERKVDEEGGGTKTNGAGDDKRAEAAGTDAPMSVQEMTLEMEMDETKVLGKRVCKKFLVPTANKKYKGVGGMVNKVYFGTVREVVRDGMYMVVYDDGDQEHFDWKEVVQARYFYESNKEFDRPRLPSVPPRKKRGRPRKSDEVILTGAKAISTGKTTSGNKSTAKRSSVKSTSKSSDDNPTDAAEAARSKGPNPLVSSGPPDEKIEGGWPKGWIKKVYARKSGATNGREDRYWFTPKEQYKLRSLTEVRKFMAKLKECNGDEVQAKKLLSKS